MNTPHILNRPHMLNVLERIQNTAANANRDIMSIAGLCTNDELADHVMSEWRRLLSMEQRAAILTFARTLVS